MRGNPRWRWRLTVCKAETNYYGIAVAFVPRTLDVLPQSSEERPRLPVSEQEIKTTFHKLSQGFCPFDCVCNYSGTPTCPTSLTHSHHVLCPAVVSSISNFCPAIKRKKVKGKPGPNEGRKVQALSWSSKVIWSFTSNLELKQRIRTLTSRMASKDATANFKRTRSGMIKVKGLDRSRKVFKSTTINNLLPILVISNWIKDKCYNWQNTCK